MICPTPNLFDAVLPTRGVSFGFLIAVTFLCAFGESPVLAESPQPSVSNHSAEDLQYFEEQVRPLLANRCFSCHGEKKQESDFRLDAREFLIEGGASGYPAVVAGNLEQSLLIQYVRREVEGMEMPPENSLGKNEVAILERWVERGLAWPKEQSASITTMEDRLQHARDNHWAFQPVRVAHVEKKSWSVLLRAWPRSRLDDFVAAKLRLNQLIPSEEADRHTLLRRLKVDLLGIPPTMEEMNAFVADSSNPGSYEQLVDRYLASPSFGERWGRHWLDVARYADTSGYTFGGADRNYKWSYTYRDYVVDAFNSDLPYDDFVVQQLAADKLELGDDNRALAGLGFLSVGRKFNNQHDDIDDLIDAVTRGFVGLTVACARCHDHKYDAIPTEDYYSLYGVFNSSHEISPPLIGDSETLAVAKRYEQQFNAVNGELRQLDDELFKAVESEAQTRIKDYLLVIATGEENEKLRPRLVREWKSLMKSKAKADSPSLMPWSRLIAVEDDHFEAAAKQLAKEIEGDAGQFLNPFVRESFLKSPPRNRKELAELYGKVLRDAYATWKEAGGNDSARKKQPPDVRQLLWYFFDPNSPAKIDRGRLNRYLSDEEKQKRQLLKSAVEQTESVQPVAYHRAMVVTDKSAASNARVFIRGNPRRRGDKVPRQGPQLLAKVQRPYAGGSGRMELAREIVDPNNPLTARVFVNRVWMHFFGSPLVATPSDFGIRCEEPEQRELLDYLAKLLVESDWSVKALMREILLSSTYRQASADRTDCYTIDPRNRLLWRMNRKRLEFEVLRDALLSVSDGLDHAMGGKPVRQFRKLSSGKRRSVYGYIDRQDLPNLLRVFDFAGPDASAEYRSQTTVPQQALFLLNSPFVLDLGQTIAKKHRGKTDLDFVQSAYQQVLARIPTDVEEEIAVRFLTSSSSKARMQSRTQFAQLLLLTNEFCHVD